MSTKRCVVCKCPLTLLRDAKLRGGRESRDLCIRCGELAQPIKVAVKTGQVRVPVAKRPKLTLVPPLGRDEDEQARVNELAKAWETRLKGSRA